MPVDPVQDIVGLFPPGRQTDDEVVFALEFLVFRDRAVLLVPFEIPVIEGCRDDVVRAAGNDQQGVVRLFEVHFCGRCQPASGYALGFRYPNALLPKIMEYSSRETSKI